MSQNIHVYIWILDVFILLFYFKNFYGLRKNHEFCLDYGIDYEI